MKKRFQNQRFLTAGIDARIPQAIQILLWCMVDIMDDPDYLQIFELQGDSKGVSICHKQEVPPYENTVFVICSVDQDFKEKVYIIDDETHATMLLAEEY